MIYTPRDWHWFVGGDTTRMWSSAAGAYVDASQVPAETPVSNILNEAELSDVLLAYGLKCPNQGVPSFVSDIQARKALRAAGLLPAVEAAVASAGGDTAIYWDRSLTVHRASPFIAAMSAALSLTPQQVDSLFIAAAQL